MNRVAMALVLSAGVVSWMASSAAAQCGGCPLAGTCEAKAPAGPAGATGATG